jgi:ketosteroid isomerase-like protein
MDQTTADITRATSDWGSAFRSGEVSRAMAFVAPHAVFVPPNEPPLVGYPAIEAWARGMFEAVTIQEIDISVDGVRAAGDWAVSHGRWHMTMAAGESTIGDTTRYVLIWERGADGAWKVVHDVWNSGLPVASQSQGGKDEED